MKHSIQLAAHADDFARCFEVMRELRPHPESFSNTQYVLASALEINVLAGKRPPLFHRGLLGGVTRRPEIDRLAADQEVGLAISVLLSENVSKCLKGKAHERRLRL